MFGQLCMIIISNLKMADFRLSQLTNYLRQFFGDGNFNLSIASDDASFRRYFRVKHNNKSLIIMDSPPSKENCRNFIKIDKILIDAGIHAPLIINADTTQGFLLLEDLGSQTFLHCQQQKFNLDLYKTAIDTLVKMQSISNKTLAQYSKNLLHQEMQLLIEWYLPKTTSSAHNKQLQTMFAILTENALNAPQVFVHRDYHSRNLMVLAAKKLAIIDFQDACIGADTYDLVSLLKDAYFQLPANQHQILLQYYYDKAAVSRNFAEFERQYDLMSLQRQLKVLGIFKRLSLRDGKHQYLNDIPKIRNYLLATATKYPEFLALKQILNHKDYQCAQ